MRKHFSKRLLSTWDANVNKGLNNRPFQEHLVKINRIDPPEHGSQNDHFFRPARRLLETSILLPTTAYFWSPPSVQHPALVLLSKSENHCSYQCTLKSIWNKTPLSISSEIWVGIRPPMQELLFLLAYTLLLRFLSIFSLAIYFSFMEAWSKP